MGDDTDRQLMTLTTRADLPMHLIRELALAFLRNEHLHSQPPSSGGRNNEHSEDACHTMAADPKAQALFQRVSERVHDQLKY